jgi:uncharacterized membrane protein
MSGRRVFITGSILWAALLAIGPFAVTRSSPGHVSYAVALAVYGAGQFICHQMPERSFYLWMAQLPVCARCTGIYVGGGLTATGFCGVMDKLGVDARRARTLVAVAAIPTAATLVFEWATGVRTSNLVRAVSGVPLGAAIVLVVAAALAVAVPPLAHAPVPSGRKVN